MGERGLTYYGDMLEKGESFQVYVSGVFFDKLGMTLDFTGKDNQLLIGETLQGIEVKCDDKYAETGNLWIETHERVSLSKEYVPSGIFRKDNTWLYVIGDYTTIFMFGKKVLVRLSSKFKEMENNIKTSKGFLLPDKIARKFAELVL